MHPAPQHDALDSGPRQAQPGGERLCAATGAVTPVADMIRFVVAPDGTVEPLPWRGSADLFTVARADGFVVVPPRTALDAGAVVEVMKL